MLGGPVGPVDSDLQNAFGRPFETSQVQIEEANAQDKADAEVGDRALR